MARDGEWRQSHLGLNWHGMTAARLSRLAAVLLLPGCGRPPAPSPFQPVADVKQLMAAVLEPAADVYWDAVGTVDDKAGSVEHAPAGKEEWDAAMAKLTEGMTAYLR